MSARTIAVLLCRIVAVVLVANILQQLPMWVPTLVQANLGFISTLFTVAMGLGGQALVALVLWFQAPRIGARVAGGSEDPGSEGLDEAGLLRAGTALIGIWVLVHALANLVLVESATYLSINENPDLASQIAERQWPQRLGASVELLLGLSLILGRDRIAALLSTARAAGRGA